MLVLGIIVGALLGGIVAQGFDGFVIGAVLGYLVASVAILKSRLELLEQSSMQGAPGRLGPEPSQAPVHSATAPGRDASGPTVAAPATPPVEARPAETPSYAQAEVRPGTDVGPNVIEQAVSAIHQFFTGGNTVVRVGVVILFFGVAFLLKYAAEHALLPIELRLAATALGAIALLVVGLRVRKKREAYGLTLEGAAVGIFYLTIFAAFRLYGLLPSELAFALLIVTCASSVALALVQNSNALAVLSVSGGFLAPVLASAGGGSHVGLFSYYLILNAGIVAIAWFKAWRLLNFVGFMFTFVIGAAWGIQYYRPEFFASTEPFLIAFFLFYVAMTVLFARRQSPELRSPVDGTLVFGVPIVGFLLQAALVKEMEFGLAWSAFALGAFYLALASLVLKAGMTRLLAEAFIALGVIFATLTIPLAVDGHWTAAAWAIEGAGVLWVALRQSRRLAMIFGVVVQVGAGIFFLAESKTLAELAVLNSAFIGSVMVSTAGLVSAFLFHRHHRVIKDYAQPLAIALLAWGLVWWYAATWLEIERYVVPTYRIASWVSLIAIMTLLCNGVGQRLAWPTLTFAAVCNIGLLMLAFLGALATAKHPFIGFGWLAWPFAFASYYVVLKRTEASLEEMRAIPHVVALWLVVAIVGWELHWLIERWLPAGDWTFATLGVYSAVALIVLSAWSGRDIWPFRGNSKTYGLVAAIPLVLFAAVWLFVVGLMESGNPVPLAFMPLLNPIDLAAMFLLLGLITWTLQLRRYVADSVWPVLVVIAAGAFLWMNAALFRAIHHFGGVRYTLTEMLGSMLAQSAVSIFWTVLAFALMFISTRKAVRPLWITGAALLSVVVVKLFLVDLSSTGTIARIVSFVGVGILLLVIGYLAPVPPRAAENIEVKS
jgi:uncharacterized membrane protein